MNQNNGGPDSATRKKLDLVLGQTVTAKILRDKPYEGENRYGKFSMYTLEVEGVETVYFPDKDTHQTLLALQLKMGDVVTFTKTASQNGKKITSHVDVQVVSRAVNGQKEKGENIPFEVPEDGYRELMERSLKDAIEATRAVNTVQWSVEDIKSIGLTIFIQRCRS